MHRVSEFDLRAIDTENMTKIETMLLSFDYCQDIATAIKRSKKFMHVIRARCVNDATLTKGCGGSESYLARDE